jgi:hypothetical protein
MGGTGSTRWNDHTRAPRVEDALALDFLDPQWKVAFVQPEGSGRLEWVQNGARVASQIVEFRLEPLQPDGSRRLVLESPDGTEQRILVEPTTVGFSHRLYARCPMDCGRRARIMYLFPGRFEVGCRQCAGLQYRSAQQHDRRLDQARRDPEGFEEERQRHQSLKSRLVTARLVFDAIEMMDAPRRGRGWGRKSMTAWRRAAHPSQ